MDRRRALRLLLASFALTLLGVLGLAPATHAGTEDEDEIRVVSTKPVDGAELTATPSEIVITFASRLPAIEPLVQLQNEQRELQSIGQPLAIQNRTALRVRVLQALPAGQYTVSYLIRPTNGKEVAGDFTFSLRSPTNPEDTNPDGTPTTTTIVKVDTGGLGVPDTNNYSGLLGIAGRTLGYLGLAAVVGALALIAVAWRDGVEYVLTVKHLWTAWALGVIGTLLTVATAASDAAGVSTARGLLPTQWGELMESSFGKALVVRLVAVAGCAYVAGRPERVFNPNSRLTALGIPAVALITYGWSRDSAELSNLVIPAGILHAAGGALWFGGAALLTRVVLAGPGDRDLVDAVKGFRRIYLPSVLALLVSGAIQTNLYLGGLGDMTSTTFGRIFLLKILAVAVMAFVATANRQYARQRLARARSLDVRPAARLRQSVRSEVVFGSVVILMAGWLAGTTAPATLASDPIKANTDTFVSEDESFAAKVTFGPKRVGARVEFHFRLLTPESIENGVVTLQPVDGKSSGIEIPILGSPNYGFDDEQGFVFGSSGDWTIAINGEGPDGPLPTLTGEFVVNNADGSPPVSVTTTVPPSTTRATVPDTSPDATDPAEAPAGASDTTDASDETDASD